jgi:hypothetical protein
MIHWNHNQPVAMNMNTEHLPVKVLIMVAVVGEMVSRNQNGDLTNAETTSTTKRPRIHE